MNINIYKDNSNSDKMESNDEKDNKQAKKVIKNILNYHDLNSIVAGKRDRKPVELASKCINLYIRIHLIFIKKKAPLNHEKVTI